MTEPLDARVRELRKLLPIRVTPANTGGPRNQRAWRAYELLNSIVTDVEGLELALARIARHAENEGDEFTRMLARAALAAVVDAGEPPHENFIGGTQYSPPLEASAQTADAPDVEVGP